MLLTLQGVSSLWCIIQMYLNFFVQKSDFFYYFLWMDGWLQNLLIPLILKLSKSLRICRFHISINTWKVQCIMPIAKNSLDQIFSFSEIKQQSFLLYGYFHFYLHGTSVSKLSENEDKCVWAVKSCVPKYQAVSGLPGQLDQRPNIWCSNVNLDYLTCGLLSDPAHNSLDTLHPDL